MDRRLRIAGIAGAVAASALILTSPSEPLPLPEPTTTRAGSGAVDVLAEGLDRPRSIAFAGGAVLVAERDGAIRVVRGGELLERPLATLRTADAFDAGLLGIAASPEFESDRALYAYYTYAEGGRLWNKVLRITESGGRLAGADTVIDGIPGSEFSNGGAVAFGPDGMLYVATGAVSDSLHLSRDPASLAGKILRLAPDGSVPPDNPFPGSPVYTLGHRGAQGIAWGPDGRMYASEQGPGQNDEINLVEAGRDYGWPGSECDGALACFDPAIEPGGIASYSGGALAPEGSLIVASLRAPGLLRMDGGGDGGLERAGALVGGLGRIRDVAQGPDGHLYAITSNTDGRGFPGPDDDRLVRITR